MTQAQSPNAGTETRIERDSMGEMKVDAHVLYGASTQRAVLNFPISGQAVHPLIIHALALLKQACARANLELKKLDRERADLIVAACKQVADALHDPAHASEMMEHFPIDVFQTGSGTSTNMNVNEVVSNIACQAAGQPIGSKDPVHPNDHVNMGQSSNDTFPTGMQVAGARAIREHLIPALQRLAETLDDKAERWDDIIKIGRTHLMDATPIRVGQEFSGFAAQAHYNVLRAQRAMVRLAQNLPIGGTAVGTGINTHPKFAGLVVADLARETSIEFKEADNHFEAQATRDCVVEASGELKTIAIALSKIANDIRWLGSGPRCGLFELSLPAIQPGSSIMPGKVNPVICESVMQVACQVVGNDAAITMGGAGGIGSLLQINLAMPMIARNLIENILILSHVSELLVDKCLNDLQVNKEIAEGMVEKSLMMCTALSPEIGYDAASKVAKAAFASGQTIREYVLEKGMIDADRLNELLDARAMTDPSA
jgi:fumarate hydratase class II